jgi:hypothetical protein
MSSQPKIPRHETPQYHKARALAEDLNDEGLAATIEMLRTMLAAYGDVLAGRRRKIDPEKLAAAYEALAERKR